MPPSSGSDGGTDLERAVLAHARDYPGDGQAKAAQALAAKGMAVSPAGVRYIWRKHGLETAQKRLRAVGGDSPDGASLSPREIAILKRGEARERMAIRTGASTVAGGEGQTDDRRRHVLLAAAELFVRHGYAGTSIRDIARSVGLMPGSVYYYFPSKDDLFIAVNREGFRQLVTRIAAALDGVVAPWDRLEIACGIHLEAVAGIDPIARITGTALFGIHEGRLLDRLRTEQIDYDAIFRDLIAALDLAPSVDRSIFRLSLLGALNWSRIWYRPGRLSPREIARRMVDVFRHQP